MKYHIEDSRDGLFVVDTTTRRRVFTVNGTFSYGFLNAIVDFMNQGSEIKAFAESVCSWIARLYAMQRIEKDDYTHTTSQILISQARKVIEASTYDT